MLLADDRVDLPPEVRHLDNALPTRREPGVVAHLYSGQTGELTSPTKNHATVTMVDFELRPGVVVEQLLPASDSGFLYVIEGAVLAGTDRTPVAREKLGWLDRPEGLMSALCLEGGPAGARVLLYAGQPQNEPVIHHGPFVAGSEAELARFFGEFRAGRFQRLSQLPPESGRSGVQPHELG